MRTNILRNTSNLTIIRERARVKNEWYELEFLSLDTPGCGYSFRCEADGTLINPSKLNRDTVAELLAGDTHTKPVVRKRETTYIEPALGRCTCGEVVELRNSLFNECDVCGTHYNMCGQRVHGPHDPIMDDIRADELTLNGR